MPESLQPCSSSPTRRRVGSDESVVLPVPDSPKNSATSPPDRKSTRLNSSHSQISYAVFCLKKKINLPGYTTEEKMVIAREFLIPKQLTDHGLTDKNIEITRPAVSTMINRYTSEAGVRNLERSIAGVCRKGAREVVSGRTRRMTIAPHRLDDLVGPPKFKPDEGHKESLIGVANR